MSKILKTINLRYFQSMIASTHIIRTWKRFFGYLEMTPSLSRFFLLLISVILIVRC